MSGTPIYSNCFSAEEQEEWVTVPRRMLSPNYQPHTHESPFTANLSHPSSPETCVPAMTWGVPSEQQQPFYPSPVSPMLDSFSASLFPDTMPLFSDDLGLELELASRVLEGSAPLDLTGLQSLQSAELFNGLFDPDVPLGLDSVPLSTDFADFLAPFESPSPSSSQGLPLSPGSSTSGTGSSPTTTPQTSDVLLCSAPDCFRTFEQSSQLRRHERKHRLPFRCEICGKGHLDKRALSRHLWAKHPEFAQQSNTRSEKVKCDECDYEGRADNVARHKKRHSKARR